MSTSLARALGVHDQVHQLGENHKSLHDYKLGPTYFRS